MQHDLLLKNAKIINEDGKVFEGLNIYVRTGVIDKISKKAYTGEAKEVIDCEGLFVTPGFVNLHAHSPMNIFKGIAEDVSIDDWFNREIWPYENKMTDEDAYWGAIAGIGEMIDNGVTAFADHYIHGGRICDAVLETGIKADIAPTIFGMAEDFLKQLEEASKLIQEKNDISSRLKLRMGPHSPYTCPDGTLKLIIDRAKDLGVGIHIHMSETERQVEESQKKYCKTPFEILYEAGGFEVPCIIAHGLWILDMDRKYLNNKTHIAVCPKTYMKLGMGHGGIWDDSLMLPLCTGTDGAASSNTLNPLEQARLFALVGKLIKNEPREFTLEDIWQMLMRGHEALSFNSGKLKEGYAADLIIWDLNRFNTLPLNNPLASIIYSAGTENILYTIVDGRPLKRNGVVEAGKETLNKLSAVSEGIRSRGKGITNLNF